MKERKYYIEVDANGVIINSGTYQGKLPEDLIDIKKVDLDKVKHGKSTYEEKEKR